jgi:hypothetical protein
MCDASVEQFSTDSSEVEGRGDESDHNDKDTEDDEEESEAELGEHLSILKS